MERASRTFRVFVSSTFADLKEERDALQDRVFPRLQTFCLERGARFQAIDLRWGVSAEAGLDQQTINICLDEVKRCQDTSPRPNFIVLLGDRYGWQPPPPQIPKEHFDQILDRVSDREAKTLLKRWYPLDENALPPEHYLKPRTGRYRNDDAWGPVERQLRAVLEDAVRDMPLEEGERRTYETSATEQEIQRGALSSLPDHVFCYFRSIDFRAGGGLPAHELMEEFVNLAEDGTRDERAVERLDALKGELRRLPRENVHEYRSRWTGESPVPITTRHLDRLCEDVYEDLVRIITQELERTERIEPIQREIDAHAAFGEERARFFTGRTEVLEWIADGVARPDGTPRLVFGAGGSGKSAVMARAAKDAARRFPDGVVTRFIGATPDSSSGRSLLDGLCREISRRFGGDPSTIPSEFRDLARDFRERLTLASEDRPLVLFLDALDQLSPADGARSLSWLPTALPPGVRLVASALSGDLMGTIERRIPPPGRMELLPMKTEEAGDLLDLWLREADRTLQKPQRKAILRQFAVDGLPLWLKLAYEEARRWTSTHEEIELPPAIDVLIKERLFARLEDKANHGPVMVSRSLGYLAAAKTGLTEDEMLDLLSAGGKEGEVLVDFKRRAPRSPDVDRLPVIVWSRLFYELEPYLPERAGDGTSLMVFYHRQLAEAAEERYLAGTDGMARHRELAAHFGDQPLEMAGGRPNLRKMSELPYQQTMAAHLAGEAGSALADGLWDEVVATLTDFEFLERKTREVDVVRSVDADGTETTTHTGIYAVRDDFDLALEVMPGRVEADGDLGRRPLILTPVRTDGALAIRCPACGHRMTLRQRELGSERVCANDGCRRPLRINPFVLPGEGGSP